MAVSKKLRWTDANGETVDVEFGADGSNVDVDGTPLTEIISEFTENFEDLEAESAKHLKHIEVAEGTDITELPTNTASYDFSDDTPLSLTNIGSGTFTSAVEDGEAVITCTGFKNAGAHGFFDFRSVAKGMNYVKVEFDAYFPDTSCRWQIAFVDMDYRLANYDGASGTTSIGSNGVIGHFGFNNDYSLYTLNGKAYSSYPEIPEVVHISLEIDFRDNSMTLKMEGQTSGKSVKATSIIGTGVSECTGIEFRSWLANSIVHIDNLSITASLNPQENTLYLVPDDTGNYSTYIYLDGEPVMVGSSDTAYMLDELSEWINTKATAHWSYDIDSPPTTSETLDYNRGDIYIVSGYIYILSTLIGNIQYVPGKGETVSYQYGWTKIASAADVDKLKTYSATPTKIGEWIDGTPIWRVAFEFNIPASTDGGTTVQSLSLWESYSDTKILDYCVRSTEDINIVDGLAAVDTGIQITYTHSSSSCTLFGWIEFVTAESNISS